MAAHGHAHTHAPLLAVPTSACTDRSPHAAFRRHFPFFQTVPMPTSIVAKLPPNLPNTTNGKSEAKTDSTASQLLQSLRESFGVIPWIIAAVILVGGLTTILLSMSVSDDFDNSRPLPPPRPHLPPNIPPYSPDRQYSTPLVVLPIFADFVTFSISGVATIADHTQLIKAALYETMQQEAAFVDEDDIAVQTNVTIPGLYHVSTECASAEGYHLLVKEVVMAPSFIVSMEQKTGFSGMSVAYVKAIKVLKTSSLPASPLSVSPPPPPLSSPPPPSPPASHSNCFNGPNNVGITYTSISFGLAHSAALQQCMDDSECKAVVLTSVMDNLWDTASTIEATFLPDSMDFYMKAADRCMPPASPPPPPLSSPPLSPSPP